MKFKVYYYTLRETIGDNALPYNVDGFATICTDNAISTSKPLDLTNASIGDLWDEVYARFYDHAIIKKSVCWWDNTIPSISTEDKQKWLYRFISILSRTYPYYKTLLDEYASAQSSLMGDVKATSKNTIKYNETPQNENVANVYEGDNHLTNFTKTEGENTSPMATKMMRLKELQDHYKRIMDDWVEEFHAIFYEEGDDD